MAKVTYIRAIMHGPKPAEDGHQYLGVTSFWHIRAPRARTRALCGQVFPKKGAVTRQTKPKAPGGSRAKSNGICTFCERIAEGKDPVFDTGPDPYVRPKHSGPKGTRANPSHYRLFEEQGQVVA